MFKTLIISMLAASTISLGSATKLPTVDTIEKFNEITKISDQRLYMAGEMSIADSGVSSPMISKESTAIANKVSDSFTQTNVQVSGVDEGDIVKTDGNYIFLLNRKVESIDVIKATPADKMEKVYSIVQNEDDENRKFTFYPQDMYIEGDFLTIIGSKQFNYYYQPNNFTTPKIDRNYLEGLTEIRIYNIKNKQEIKLLKSFETKGSYHSSRRKGKNFFVVSNQYVYNHEGIDLKRLYYFPEFRTRSILNISSFSLENLNTSIKTSSYLVPTENIYMSNDNLYIASANYQEKFDMPQKTTIYKFNLTGTDVLFKNNLSVNGTVLNQFSMDEYKGNFRIATTEFDKSKKINVNNMFIADENMNILGKVNNIAPDESIQSVRFMGDKAYMVTFKQTDPLFVIDLKDAKNPKILGELKIPGFSTYLHPYDDKHLIGFGVETKENNGNAFNDGIKISMFDISDPLKPKEQFKEVISGGGYVYSELLYNHKALMFNKEKNLMAFPIRKGKFDGAYIYKIDLQKGFLQSGKITHGIDTNLSRILMIGDNFYTVSDFFVKVHDKDIKEIKRLFLLD